MLSVPDMAIIGALALIFFGPDQLPKVARSFGRVVRDVQNTSQNFIREMERAADDAEERERYRGPTHAGFDAAEQNDAEHDHLEHDDLEHENAEHDGGPAARQPESDKPREF